MKQLSSWAIFALTMISLAVFFAPKNSFAYELSGNAGIQGRLFLDDGPYSGQKNEDFSIFLEPTLEINRNNDREKFAVELFGRIDSQDKNRSHADIRRFDWSLAAEDWELRIGIGKVFWGVTESVHLVDIINQTDFIENFDGEKKLGQPMINIAWVRDFGTFDLFVLPYFRERTFPGKEGRFRLPLTFAEESTFESKQKERHTDFALRWGHSFGPSDIGISYFEGTNRYPIFKADQKNGITIFIPHYSQIKQAGLDLQYTYESWLWKMEAIYRDDISSSFTSAALGFEYGFTNLSGSGIDLGLLSEYLYDSRKAEALTPFEDDLFLGSRLALNDENDSQLLAGVILDLKTRAAFYSLEGSRRISNYFQLTLEARIFSNISDEDLFAKNFETESYLQLEASYSF